MSWQALRDGSGTVDTATGRSSFSVAGASCGGNPLVLLPSLGGGAQHWGDFGRRLVTERCTVALDPPGFGRSSSPPAWLTTKILAEHVRAALDSLGIAHFDLFGCSLGGLVAMRLASMTPERVQSLSLASVAARGRDFAPRRLSRAVKLMTDFVASPRPKADIARDIAGSDEPGAEPVEPPVANAAWSRGRVLHFLGAALAHDASRELGQLSMPALLLYGEKDVLLSADAQQRLREQLPHASLKTIPAAGHDLVNEAPDTCAQAVLAFLRARSVRFSPVH